MRMDRPVRGAVLRANPLALIGVGAVAVLGAFAIRDLTVGLVALGCYAAVAVLVLPSWRYPLVCAAFTTYSAGFIVYAAWRGGQPVPELFTPGLRVFVLAWPGAVLAGYLDVSRLGEYLTLGLRLPARFSAAFTAALQRFAALAHAWGELARARRSRGLGVQWYRPWTVPGWLSSMTFALLVHALRGATRTSIAMDARGFADAHHRTWAEPAPWTRTDRAVLATGLALALVAPLTTLLT